MIALKSFGLAVLFACAWFAGVMLMLGGHEPSPFTHIVILLVPLLVCGLIQYRFTRNLAQTTARKVVQIGTAAILAPVLATAAIWFVWIVLLGRSE